MHNRKERKQAKGCRKRPIHFNLSWQKKSRKRSEIFEISRKRCALRGQGVSDAAPHRLIVREWAQPRDSVRTSGTAAGIYIQINHRRLFPSRDAGERTENDISTFKFWAESENEWVWDRFVGTPQHLLPLPSAAACGDGGTGHTS